MKTNLSAERVLDAPAEVVYHLLADYREHHRAGPEGFLPPAFIDLIACIKQRAIDGPAGHIHPATDAGRGHARRVACAASSTRAG